MPPADPGAVSPNFAPGTLSPGTELTVQGEGVFAPPGSGPTAARVRFAASAEELGSGAESAVEAGEDGALSCTVPAVPDAGKQVAVQLALDGETWLPEGGKTLKYKGK